MGVKIVKDKAHSTLDKLKKQSKESSLPFQMMLQLFCQEEFLRKLSLSKYVNCMILKGGMFIYTLTNFESRPTKDIDFSGRNIHASVDNIEKVMKEICSIDTGNDFLYLEVLQSEPITAEMEYPGVRTKFVGRIKNTRNYFSIDIGVNDVVVPSPVKREIATRLPEFSKPIVYTYSVESVVAEKLDAILQRMEGTSRMKDFYDIYYLAGLFDFEGIVLQEAISKTILNRKHDYIDNAFTRIAEFANNHDFVQQWANYEPAKEAHLDFDTIIHRIVIFLNPIYSSIITGEQFEGKWDCSKQSWRDINAN